MRKFELLLSEKEMASLGFEKIPEPHRQPLRERIEQFMEHYYRDHPLASRRLIIKASVSGAMNNFYFNLKRHSENFVNSAAIGNAIRKLDFDSKKWIAEHEKHKSKGFGFSGGKLTPGTNNDFKLWPVFVEALKHVDDHKELTR